MNKITWQRNDKITSITINNPDKRNAFDKEMSIAVADVIKDAEKNKQRLIIISSNISHGIFSAGHDLHELSSAHDLAIDPMFEMFDAVTSTPIPVIAMVTGDVYAGALHLLMVCDMVYATTNSKVVITANKMGVPFSLRNYQYWLAVMSVHKVKELFYTGSTISAEDAYNSGIFNEIFSTEDDLKTKINQISNQILTCCADGIANTKLQLNTIINTVSVDHDATMKINQQNEAVLNSAEFAQRVNALLAKLHK